MRGIIIITTLIAGAGNLAAQESPSYAKQVRPFFVKYCLECHNAKTVKGGLNLETYAALREGGDGGSAVEAGKPDDSRLVLLIEGKDDPVMPPKKSPRRPSKDEIAMVRAWVAAGAKDDSGAIKVTIPDVKPRQDSLAPVRAVALTPAGDFVYYARGEALHSVRLDSKLDTVLFTGSDITAAAVAPKAERIALGHGRSGAKTAVALLAFDKTQARHEIKAAHADSVLDIALSGDGRLAASAGYDTRVKIFDALAGKELHTLKEHSDAVYGLAFSPDGKQLASCSADRAVKVWDTVSGKLLYTLGEATDWLYAIAWSPDGRRLAAGGVDKSIRVYEPGPSGARIVQSVFAHEAPVVKLAFAPDSQTLYSVGQDRVVKAWDAARMVERKVFERQPDSILSLAISGNGKKLALGRYDGAVVVLDAVTGASDLELKTAPKARDEKKQSLLPEANAGNSPATGQKIGLPSSIAGSLDRAGDVDFYRFEAKKGQQLGIQLVAAGKSKLEPALQLCDLAGRVLATSLSGHLGHTFAEAGSYAIGVHDREFRGGADMTYQLHLGAMPVVSAVYPLGVQRGTSAQVQLDGVFLDQARVAVTVPASAAPGSSVPVAVSSKLGMPLGAAQVVVGEFAEVVRPASPGTAVAGLSVPGTGNGRLLQPAQMDVWSFKASKGQKLLIEVHAARIGTDLDSILEILDREGQPVPRAVLRCQAKTYVTFRNHDSVAPGIRLEHWDELAMNDYLYVGTELMRIQALPLNPDADCNFWSSGGKRLGFLETTPTHHSLGTPMYKVSIHPPGSIFPPNGFPVFTLYYRNDDGGPGYGRDSRILFDAPADGDYRIRIRDARGLSGARFGYRLTIRPPRPDFAVRFSPTAPTVWKGGSVPITLTAERFDGYDGPIRVHFKDLPPGLSAPASTIEAGTYTTAVPLFADAAATVAKSRLALRAEADIGGVKRTKEVPGETIALAEPGDLVTTTEPTEIVVRPGGQVKFTVKIERRNGFTGRVPVEVRGLPHGVRVLDIGLNGILVTERETRRTIVLQAEPWVEAGERPIIVLARREGKNTEHGARPVLLRIGNP